MIVGKRLRTILLLYAPAIFKTSKKGSHYFSSLKNLCESIIQVAFFSGIFREHFLTLNTKMANRMLRGQISTSWRGETHLIEQIILAYFSSGVSFSLIVQREY